MGASLSPSPLLAIFLNRRLDLRDRVLDLVVGEVALDARPIVQRERAFELRLELAGLERVGRRRRLVGERLGSPADDDRRYVVAICAATLFASSSSVAARLGETAVRASARLPSVS